MGSIRISARSHPALVLHAAAVLSYADVHPNPTDDGMSLEDSLSRLEAEIDALVARERGGGDGFQKGLTQGLLLALLVLRADAMQVESPPPAERPALTSKAKKPKPPPKDQLDLFGS
jgi:hypothetical protein